MYWSSAQSIAQSIVLIAQSIVLIAQSIGPLLRVLSSLLRVLSSAQSIGPLLSDPLRVILLRVWSSAF